MKRVLITGAGSYIGEMVKGYLLKKPDRYLVDTLDMKDKAWRQADFSGYDAVFHVAGIAHRKETKENAHLYYEVNEKLAIETAEKAKREGVRQFIILSTMNVYGLRKGSITKDRAPNPKSNYAIAKNNADLAIRAMAEENFRVAILRPPMVYGRGCKGNYQLLKKFALKSPVFPSLSNQRSMIFVDNLAQFVQKMVDEESEGLFFPQDAQYVNTVDMVGRIAQIHGKKIGFWGLFNPFVRLGLALGVPVLEKVFGDLTYEQCDAVMGRTFAEIMEQVEG